jgi:NAD(P) transhydrogenase subunit alpha
MLLHIPKSKSGSETRTPLTPDSAKKLSALGITMTAECDHGLQSGFSNEAYRDAGVEMVSMQSQLSTNPDLYFSIEPPTPQDIQSLPAGSTYLGIIDPFNNIEAIHAFAKQGVNAISMEMIPRTTIAQKMDVLSSQANLAGYYAVIKATEKLNKILPMMMTPAGTLAPASVFVIGVGVAGLQAIATAKRLGARVQAFDTRPTVEEQVKSLGAKFVKVDLGETGQTEQGYAKELTAEQLELQRQGMAKVAAKSDIVITTAKLFGRKAPVIVTKDMVAGMQLGSVIVDLAAETGGNVDGTVQDQTIVTENGVIIIGTSKLEQSVPTHASQMLAANFYNFVEHFWDKENQTLNLNLEDEIIQGSLLTLNGEIVHERFK